MVPVGPLRDETVFPEFQEDPNFKPDPLEVRARECLLARAALKDAENALDRIEEQFVREMDDYNELQIANNKSTRTAVLVDGVPVHVAYTPEKRKVKYG